MKKKKKTPDHTQRSRNTARSNRIRNSNSNELRADISTGWGRRLARTISAKEEVDPVAPDARRWPASPLTLIYAPAPNPDRFPSFIDAVWLLNYDRRRRRELSRRWSVVLLCVFGINSNDLRYTTEDCIKTGTCRDC